MRVVISVSVQVMKTADLSYGDRSRYAHPSESANWNILNNVNLSVYDEAGIEQYYDFEWLAYGNVGGSEGVDFRTSWFANNRNQTNSSRRGDIVVSKDFYQRPLRIEVGDVFSASKGYLYSAPIGGIKFSKASKKLQPLRKQSPINEQDFYLPSSAELAVIVNGFVVSRIRLPAGKYSLSDLPLATGNNEVQIKAEYLTGESEIFNFSRFYNGRLLAEGDSDYAVSLGVVTNKTAQEYRYDNTLLVNGFFDLGLSRGLTAGASTSVSKNGQLLSLNFSHGLPWGNLASQWSQSHSQRQDGYAFSINSEHSVWGVMLQM
jgi:outer membrane usher protein